MWWADLHFARCVHFSCEQYLLSQLQLIACSGCELEAVRIHEEALAPYMASEGGISELEQILLRHILIKKKNKKSGISQS